MRSYQYLTISPKYAAFAAAAQRPVTKIENCILMLCRLNDVGIKFLGKKDSSFIEFAYHTLAYYWGHAYPQMNCVNLRAGYCHLWWRFRTTSLLADWPGGYDASHRSVTSYTIWEISVAIFPV